MWNDEIKNSGLVNSGTYNSNLETVKGEFRTVELEKGT